MMEKIKLYMLVLSVLIVGTLSLLAFCASNAATIDLTVVSPGCAGWTLTNNTVTCTTTPIPPDPPIPPIPPIPPVGFCAQYAKVMPITATWATQQSWHSSDSGSFGDNVIWMATLVVPPATLPSVLNGRFTIFEYTGPATPRQISISLSPCDFRKKDYTGANGPLALGNGSTAEISYGVGVASPTGPAALTPGKTYYISMRNWKLDPTPGWSCGLPTCNAGLNDIPATP
jgi:hypothetical protein